MALKISTVRPPVVIAELKILPISLPNVPPMLVTKVPANCESNYVEIYTNTVTLGVSLK